MAAGNMVECGACKRGTPRGIKCIYCGALLVAEVECTGCPRRFGAHITRCIYCGTKRLATADVGEAPRGVPSPPPVRDARSKQLERAAEAIGAGRHSDVLQIVEPILVAEPDDVDALVLRGEALRRLGRYEAALQALRRAVELAPEMAICWYSLAFLELEVDMKPEAMVSLLGCLLRLPRAPDAHRSMLAMMLRKNLAQLDPQIAAEVTGKIAQGEQAVAWSPEEARQLGALLAAARQRASRPS